MRTIQGKEFSQAFREALIEANFNLRDDVAEYMRMLKEKMENEDSKKIIDIYLENSRIACKEKRGVCQDTGYIQVYFEQGARVSFDFDPQALINEITAEVYEKYALRKSMAHPVSRINTGDNTPAFLNVELVDGEGLKVTIMLKGGGSENVSATALMLPTSSEEAIADWVAKSVEQAGAKACPPYIIGVGIGGTLEKAVGASKKLLLRRIGESAMDETETRLAALIREKVNILPIGFQGLGFGETTMSVQVKCIPCHIATLPVGLSIGCNAIRQAEFSL